MKMQTTVDAKPTGFKQEAWENKASVIGKLAEPAQIGDTRGGKRAQFTLLVPRSYKTAAGERVEEEDSVRVIAWRALAQQCEGLPEGSVLLVQGRIRSWGIDGKNPRYSEVQAELLEVLSQPQAKSTVH